MFATELRKRRVAHMRGYPRWRWHVDEAAVKVNGKLCYMWRAVDHEGEVLEAVVSAKRDKAAALKLLKRIIKKYGAPRSIVTALSHPARRGSLAAPCRLAKSLNLLNPSLGSGPIKFLARGRIG
jgi:transposase-like protein